VEVSFHWQGRILLLGGYNHLYYILGPISSFSYYNYIMTNPQKGIWSFYNSRHDQSTTGIDPMNNISIIIRIHFVVTLFQHLKQLFEDAEGVEENIRASRRIRDRDCFENLHAHEQGNCQYISDFEEKGNNCCFIQKIQRPTSPLTEEEIDMLLHSHVTTPAYTDLQCSHSPKYESQISSISENVNLILNNDSHVFDETL
jgi:hypothetical protein